MTTKPGPTETRVRAALLRLFKRCGENEFSWPSSEVREEVHRDFKRRVGVDTVGDIGRKMAKGPTVLPATGPAWTALADGIEATYERGVFRVRKRASAGRVDTGASWGESTDDQTSEDAAIVHGEWRPVRDGQIKNRNPLETPEEPDATIQVTWTLGRPIALVTVRAKDQDLTAPQLRSFAAALLEAAADIESDESDEPRKRAKR